jgi:hypothetical protein
MPLLRTGLLAATLALTASASAAASEPHPGEWESGAARAKGAKAVVEFTVEAGSVSPLVRIEVRRCGGARKPWSRELSLASVPVSGGAFQASHRKRVGRRAKVRLRLEGAFDSEYEAHGTVRGTLKLRGVECTLPKLSWQAELTVPYEDEEAYDEEDEAYDDEYDEPEPDPYDPEADAEYGPDEDEGYEDEESASWAARVR